MEDTLQSVEFTFENLDYIVIPVEYFRTLQMKEIHTRFYRKTSGEIKPQKTVKNLVFVLNQKANKEASVFDGDVYSITVQESNLFERFQQNDITHIKLNHFGGCAEEFSVVWDEANFSKICFNRRK